ncbi:alpha/beta hydrolase family esterase [Streptomyces beijiangensis]|uniref:Prolyl oligopeptidase family serine peptidase n=1 Tax=Streptomyces beijiangensis TaxID=163361 RepID=A0A939JD87_9ACTN|nr:PHB depolymerase family esterase [Streptomyces beijiangensis]MBO0511771.1 prolyl oligopeptidase family serine peptidase [Streptomyces beijiangensis]
MPSLLSSRRWYAALLLGLSFTAGCTGSADPDPTRDPAASAPTAAAGTGARPATDTREQLRVDGSTRTYLLHSPAARDDSPKPLVIAFHGSGEGAAGMRERTGLDRAAASRSLLIAYPEGLRHAWGAGSVATGERPDPDADVRFTEALVQELVRTGKADPDRVYAVGFSNGGSMALRMAAQRPGLLAGAASVAGQLPTGAARVRPTGPVPVMIIHGADDPVRPVGGLPDPGPARAGAAPITPTMSSLASAQAFAAADGARGASLRSEAGYDRITWRPGPSGATVQLLVMHGAGHTWPGTSATPPAGFGRVSRVLDATGTILGFFADNHRGTG